MNLFDVKLPTGLEIVDRAPSVNEYCHLRKITSLSPFPKSAAEAGLKSAWFSVSVLHEQRTVGMGRIIGDGGLFFQIVDIAVEPELQGQGVGAAIMATLMNHLAMHAPSSAFVSLLADVPADRLYRKFGFEKTAPRTIGMATRIRRSHKDG